MGCTLTRDYRLSTSILYYREPPYGLRSNPAKGDDSAKRHIVNFRAALRTSGHCSCSSADKYSEEDSGQVLPAMCGVALQVTRGRHEDY